MTLQQYLLILLARRHFAAAIFVIVALIGVAVTLLMPRQYSATTSLVVDVKVDPIVGTLMPSVGSPGYMVTQTEIIQSERTASGVVRLLKLDQNAKLVADWREATDGKISFENYYAEKLLKSLVVSSSRASGNIITIAYSGRDPEFVTAVANGFAQSYIDLTIDLRVDPARQYAAWFDERQKVLRSSLEQAQAKLSAFQKEKGIVVVSAERLDQETERLNALMTQLAMVQTERVDSASRERISGSELSPDVLQNPIIQGLKAELARAETKLSEISGNAGPNHPMRIQLERQIAALKDQVSMEMRRVYGGAATASRGSELKEASLKSLIEKQKQHVLELRAQRDEIDVMVKDVDTARRAYESVSQRISQLSLESQSEQANVHVLSPAVRPVEPSRPNISRFIVGSLLLGVLAGIGAAIGLELVDRRVRVAEDIATDDVPLLGVLASRRTFLDRWRQGAAGF